MRSSGLTAFGACGLVMALGGLALADTAAAGPCSVAYARAPQEARAAIDAWLRKEPACATTLTMRIVQTSGGWYLLALLPDGRTHDRVVPDLETAGALVSSWVADENVAPVVTPVPMAIDVEPASPPSEQPARPSARSTPPRTIDVFQDAANREYDRGELAHSATTTRWLSLAALHNTADETGRGVRANIDLWARGAWTFGAGFEVMRGWAYGSTETQDISTTYNDVRGLVTAAHTTERGHWQLRVGGGAGLDFSTIDNFAWDRNDMDTEYGTSGYSFVAEASASVMLRMGQTWGIAVGATTVFLPAALKPLTDMDDHEFTLRAPMQLELGVGIARAL